MIKILVLSIICCSHLVLVQVSCSHYSSERFGTNSTEDKSESKQVWNYVNVRPNAFMFWWAYYTTHTAGFENRPLILWLQGGPGGSSTGFGNFQEIGPLDVKLKTRSTTWLQKASLLFIDNPVGTGYSYTTSDDAYTTDVQMIAQDLLVVIKSFMKEAKEFQKVPFYIFSESYGGKMTAAFSQTLYKAVKAGDIVCNFQGFSMGDSWINPMYYVNTWGPYLFATSLVDNEGLNSINKAALAVQKAFDAGDFTKATALWSVTENTVEATTNGVNFYNILKWNSQLNQQPIKGKSSIERLYQRHVATMANDELSQLMNGAIRKKLQIIPENVTWGAQSGMVFSKQSGDFMKPVDHIVDDLIANSTLKVVVFNGQLDLICDTPGTEAWVDLLKWDGLPMYRKAPRKPILRKETTTAFVKKYKNFAFFWILDAGHMIPADQGETALQMVDMIIEV